jgi:Domain of unknown function (DUF4126)
MNIELIFSILLGLGLSASCGFRVFVPLLVANGAALAGYHHFTPDFAWLATWPAFYVLATATVVEIAAYYVPWVDNLLDTLAAPAALVAGTVLTASVIPESQPVLKWGLGLVVGGGSAGLIATGTGLLRAGSTAVTGGFGNPVVATGENVAATSLSVMAIAVPLLAGALVVGLLFWAVKKLLGRRAKPKS